jgi:hypothetical protein
MDRGDRKTPEIAGMAARVEKKPQRRRESMNRC